MKGLLLAYKSLPYRQMKPLSSRLAVQSGTSSVIYEIQVAQSGGQSAITFYNAKEYPSMAQQKSIMYRGIEIHEISEFVVSSPMGPCISKSYRSKSIDDVFLRRASTLADMKREIDAALERRHSR